MARGFKSLMGRRENSNFLMPFICLVKFLKIYLFPSLFTLVESEGFSCFLSFSDLTRLSKNFTIPFFLTFGLVKKSSPVNFLFISPISVAPKILLPPIQFSPLRVTFGILIAALAY